MADAARLRSSGLLLQHVRLARYGDAELVLPDPEPRCTSVGLHPQATPAKGVRPTRSGIPDRLSTGARGKRVIPPVP